MRLDCGVCGGANQAGKRFCRHCGAPLSSSCPRCGLPVDLEQRFCDECGAPLPAREANTAGGLAVDPGGLEESVHAERRRVSVLFADLVGFTTIAEGRDAEEVRELLSSYFEVCQSAVARYGGTVEKFIGDAVFALWGAPVAHEDDAERAVRCALELLEAIERLGGEHRLVARAGILTGEAAVNLGARGQGLVAGDLVNSASRLQAAARPNTVLVGEGTYRATNHAIAFAEIGDLVVKGKEEPIAAWRALRVVAKRRGIGRSEGIEAPLSGRDRELKSLKDALHALASEHRPRLISVTGIPGIGKSRLAWEFLKYADGLAEDVYWHQGRSPAYGEAISFWALAEMVRMRAAIGDDDEDDVARQKLTRVLSEFVPDVEDAAWIEPRLAHLLGLAEAPPGQREETFAAWRAFFERIAQRAPLVMVFEDLQWADQGTMDFIESILEWSRQHPILIVTLARPELLERRATWGAGQRSFASLHLEPLAPEAMRSLVDGLVRDLPEAFAAELVERSEGVPLYAVETVRMLASKGLLVERAGAYDVAGELAGLDVPESLHDLIASRLDTLPALERSVLQEAAVLGKTFHLDALAAMSGRPQSELTSALRDLCRREILSIDSDPRSPERGQYGFLQALLRDVAYSTMARKDRRARHLAAARYLEGLGDEELAGLVAAHFLEAAQNTPDGSERDELGAEARGRLAVASRRALSLGSPAQARSYAEQALETDPPPAECGDLSELAATAADRMGADVAARRLFQDALAAYEAVSSRAGMARVSAALARVLGNSFGDYEGAIALAKQALARLGAGDDAVVQSPLALAIAGLQARVGRPAESLSWAERALVLIEQTDDAGQLAHGILTKAAALFSLGRHREAVMLCRGALSTAEAAGLHFEQCRALQLLGLCLVDDDPREALSVTMRAIEVMRRTGDRPLLVMQISNALEASLLVGELELGARLLAELDEALADRRSPGEETGVGDEVTLIAGAILAALRGEHEAAAAKVAAVEAAARESQWLHARATLLQAKAVLALAQGDDEVAYALAGEVVAEDPSGINSPSALAIQAHSALLLGDTRRATDVLGGMARFRGRSMRALQRASEAAIALASGEDPDQALAAHRVAQERLGALGARLEQGLCQLDVAAIWRGRPGGEQAAAAAAAIFTEIGARALVRRANALRAH
ncbi:MAG: AAA family ATPase [Actinomycetota bacterium]|nr:AAA family ATPase [Actinomycetota bacterium]